MDGGFCPAVTYSNSKLWTPPPVDPFCRVLRSVQGPITTLLTTPIVSQYFIIVVFVNARPGIIITRITPYVALRYTTTMTLLIIPTLNHPIPFHHNSIPHATEYSPQDTAERILLSPHTTTPANLRYFFLSITPPSFLSFVFIHVLTLFRVLLAC